MTRDEAIALIRANNDQHKAAMRDWFNEEVMTCEFPNDPSRPIKVKPTWLVFEP